MSSSYSKEGAAGEGIVRRKTFLGSPFHFLMFFCGTIILLFIVLPLFQMVSQPPIASIAETIRDPEVLSSIWLSVYTAGAAALISFLFGTPLAYLLARHEFFGKKLMESIIDLPIMIPHPVVGIAILSLMGRGHFLGQLMAKVGLRIMGSVTGIITVLTFVGLPFYINAAKAGFESVPVRLEHVSRSLGAGKGATFFRVSMPLTWRHMLSGVIMCAARAVSEFGAVVIVAYHPMIAPVLMYQRFTAYGLKYSQPVGVWLILVCLVLFLSLRLVTLPKKVEQ
jgi:molybdate/tungstate transport system permease protein